MQNAGQQYGQGGASSHQTTAAFGHSETTTPSGSITSSLRQFRRKPEEKHQQQETTQTTVAESHVARVAPHNHFPHNRTTDCYPRYPIPYQDYSVPSQVKYSEISEPHQSIQEHISPSVIQKAKGKEYMEMCNIQQPHMKQPYADHLNGQQAYPDPNVLSQNQYIPKEAQVQSHYKAESQYYPKEHQYPGQIPHQMQKYNMPTPQVHKFPENDFLSKLQRIHPSMARSIMSDHHLQESQRTYQNMDQSRMYPHHNQRYMNHSSSMQGNLYPHRYMPPQPYSNYPASCSYTRSPQMAPRFPAINPHERSISPRRTYSDGITMTMSYGGIPPKISPNYHQYNSPEYTQHYQQRRPSITQDYYQQHCRPAQYLQHQMPPQEIPESRVTVSDNIKQYIENWADEETASEMNQMETNRMCKENIRVREDQPTETVYTINASELQYLEPLVANENGIPLVASENGQYIIKSGVSIDNASGMIRIIDKNNQMDICDPSGERIVNLHIMDPIKPDCMLANKPNELNQRQTNENLYNINDKSRVVIHQNTVIQSGYQNSVTKETEQETSLDHTKLNSTLPTITDEQVSLEEELNRTIIRECRKETADKNCSPINLEQLEALSENESQQSSVICPIKPNNYDSSKDTEKNIDSNTNETNIKNMPNLEETEEVKEESTRADASQVNKLNEESNGVISNTIKDQEINLTETENINNTNSLQIITSEEVNLKSDIPSTIPSNDVQIQTDETKPKSKSSLNDNLDITDSKKENDTDLKITTAENPKPITKDQTDMSPTPRETKNAILETETLHQSSNDFILRSKCKDESTDNGNNHIDKVEVHEETIKMETEEIENNNETIIIKSLGTTQDIKIETSVDDFVEHIDQKLLKPCNNLPINNPDFSNIYEENLVVSKSKRSKRIFSVDDIINNIGNTSSKSKLKEERRFSLQSTREFLDNEIKKTSLLMQEILNEKKVAKCVKTPEVEDVKSFEDSKVALENIKASVEDNKISLGDGKLELEDSKLSLEDSKLFLEDSKPSLEDKIPLEDGKLSLEDSKLSLEDSKPSSENIRLSLEDDKLFLEDTEISTKNCKLYLDDTKPLEDTKEDIKPLEVSKPALDINESLNDDKGICSENVKSLSENPKLVSENTYSEDINTNPSFVDSKNKETESHDDKICFQKDNTCSVENYKSVLTDSELPSKIYTTSEDEVGLEKYKSSLQQNENTISLEKSEHCNLRLEDGELLRESKNGQSLLTENEPLETRSPPSEKIMEECELPLKATEPVLEQNESLLASLEKRETCLNDKPLFEEVLQLESTESHLETIESVLNNSQPPQEITDASLEEKVQEVQPILNQNQRCLNESAGAIENKDVVDIVNLHSTQVNVEVKTDLTNNSESSNAIRLKKNNERNTYYNKKLKRSRKEVKNDVTLNKNTSDIKNTVQEKEILTENCCNDGIQVSENVDDTKCILNENTEELREINKEILPELIEKDELIEDAKTGFLNLSKIKNTTEIISVGSDPIVEETVDSSSKIFNDQETISTVPNEVRCIENEIILHEKNDTVEENVELDFRESDLTELSQLQEIQYRNVIRVEEPSVLLHIAGELVEINVNTVSGKKVITVVPLSSSAVVDLNDNYETLDGNDDIDPLKLDSEENTEILELETTIAHSECVEPTSEIIIGMDLSLEEEIQLDLEQPQRLYTKAAKKAYDNDLQIPSITTSEDVYDQVKTSSYNANDKVSSSHEQVSVKKRKIQNILEEPKVVLKPNKLKPREPKKQDDNKIEATPDVNNDDDEFVPFKELIKARKLKKMKMMEMINCEEVKADSTNKIEELVKELSKEANPKPNDKPERKNKTAADKKKDTKKIKTPSNISNKKEQNEKTSIKRKEENSKLTSGEKIKKSKEILPKTKPIKKVTFNESSFDSNNETKESIEPSEPRDNKSGIDHETSTKLKNDIDNKKKLSLEEYNNRKRKTSDKPEMQRSKRININPNKIPESELNKVKPVLENSNKVRFNRLKSMDDVKTIKSKETHVTKRKLSLESLTIKSKSFDWEETQSPKTNIPDNNHAESNNSSIDSIEENKTTDSKLTIDSKNPADEILQNYKEQVESKLSSLNIQIPRVIKPVSQQIATITNPFSKSETTKLMERFLRNERLNPEEMQNIRKIISYKRLMQRLKNSVVNPSLSLQYEVKKELGERDMKLHLKKMPLKRRKKRFRNLYSESTSETDTDQSESKTSGDYSVIQSNCLAGVVPKLIIKRKPELPLPFVKLERLDMGVLINKKRRYSEQ